MEKNSRLTKTVFILYLAILTWAVIFKFALKGSDLPFRHEINLIPFDESTFADGRLRLSEIILNLLAFIPFGMYISVFKRNWSAGKRVLAGFLLSLAYEVSQYVFSLGLLDVTDFMTNTAGTWIGVGLYSALRKTFGEKTEKIVSRTTLVLEIIFFCLASVLIFANRNG